MSDQSIKHSAIRCASRLLCKKVEKQSLSVGSQGDTSISRPRLLPRCRPASAMSKKESLSAEMSTRLILASCKRAIYEGFFSFFFRCCLASRQGQDFTT